MTPIVDSDFEKSIEVKSPGSEFVQNADPQHRQKVFLQLFGDDILCAEKNLKRNPNFAHHVCIWFFASPSNNKATCYYYVFKFYVQ